MPWALIAELIFKIIQFILSRRKSERHGLLARLRDAQAAAHDGDMGPLTSLHNELSAEAAVA